MWSEATPKSASQERDWGYSQVVVLGMRNVPHSLGHWNAWLLVRNQGGSVRMVQVVGTCRRKHITENRI